MIEGLSPVSQAALGTLFTWALTAAGSALVFLFSSGQREILDGSLGFAAGVMTAASYWSLLDPAIETAKVSQLYGPDGEYAFIPVAIGFIAGAVFVYTADKFFPMLGDCDPVSLLSKKIDESEEDGTGQLVTNGRSAFDKVNICMDNYQTTSEFSVTRRKGWSNDAVQASGTSNTCDVLFRDENNINNEQISSTRTMSPDSVDVAGRLTSWRRIMLLILAIVVHNIPEGLAVGVGFGAIGKTSSATFSRARSLAIGIGIQNFPEGLAVSLPLRASGMSIWKSFWYGQLSGMVEPVAGVLGALAVTVAEPLLPYTLAFAAGAMIYVVIDDIIPEAQTCGNGRLASICSIVGFVVMMSLDVGLS